MTQGLLPATILFAFYQGNGRLTKPVVGHCLDFDLVVVRPSKQEAVEALEYSVKAYVDYGLQRGWAEHLHFPAPSQFWDKLPDMAFEYGKPIHCNDNDEGDKLIVIHATAKNLC